jgi:Kef-type K+ transport system membrane component KefB
LIFLLSISGLAYVLFTQLIGLSSTEALSFSFALALLFSLTSPTVLDVILFQVERKELPSYLARFIVSVTSFWGILGLAFLVFFSPHGESFAVSFWQRGSLLALSTGLPLLLASLFHRLTKRKLSEEELLLFLLGLVFLCAGVAESLGIPPLYPTMILGIAYSNLTRKQERLYPLLLNTEKPMFVVLFILVGALWQPELSGPLGLVIFLLILVKFLVLIGLVSRLTSFLRFPFPFSPWYGLCFLSSGVMGVTFTVCVCLWWGLSVSQVFMSVGLISVICLDFISPWVVRSAVVQNKKYFGYLGK